MIRTPDPDRRELRVFAVVLPVTVAILGAVARFRFDAPEVGRGIWLGGALLSVLYLVVPRARRPIFLAISWATYPVGYVMSHVVLLAVFAVVVTPIALLLRLLGRDPLHRRRDPAAPSYWRDRPGGGDVRRYLHQY